MSAITLYDASATSFQTLGLGILSDAIRCEVTEEINGEYELMLEYPVNGLHYSEISLRALIVCDVGPSESRQAFRIYRVDKPINGTVTIYARHISYDLSGYPVRPFATFGTADDAIEKLSEECLIENPFNMTVGFEANGTFAVDAPSSIRSWMGGRDGSLLDVFGGEWEFDNYNCRLVEHRGEDRGASIRYGSNLKSIDWEDNEELAYTGVWGYYSYVFTKEKDQIDSDPHYIAASVDEVVEYYAAGTSKTTPPPDSDFVSKADWEDDPSLKVSVNKEKPYLWNYEEYTTNGGTTAETDKRLVGHYGWTTIDDTEGQIDDFDVEYDDFGNSLVPYEHTARTTPNEYYAISNSSSVEPPEKDDNDKDNWHTSVPKYTEEKPYLWNYTKTHREAKKEMIIFSDVIPTGITGYTKVLTVDLSDEFEAPPTKAQLNSFITEYISDNKLGENGVNITLDFVELSEVKTPIYLGDTITLYFNDERRQIRCNRVTWDVLKERYSSIEVGDSNYKGMADAISRYAAKSNSGGKYAGSGTMAYIDNSSRSAESAYFDYLEANYAKIETLEAETGIIHNLFADYASIDYLTANYIDADHIRANYLETGVLRAEFASIDFLTANYIDAHTITTDYLSAAQIQAQYATIGELTADRARIDTLEADTITTNELNAQIARIDTIEANYITTGTLEADYITAHDIQTTYLTAENATLTYATISNLNATNASIQNIEANYVQTDTLEANYATINELTAATARITTLESTSVTTQTLEANYAKITDLEATNAAIDNIEANYVTSQYLNTNYLTADNITGVYATIQNLNSATARISAIESDYVDVGSLTAAEARITDIESDYVRSAQLSAATADIDLIKANYVTTNALETGYLDAENIRTNFAVADLANVTNSWIQSGVIKNAAIKDAMIDTLSASKLTAGTIDANVITVTNLNADNITVGTINGQLIGDESIDLDKLSQEVPTKAYLDSLAADLQSQIDDAIETYTSDTIPTLLNYPASSWDTDALKQKHIGDVLYLVNDMGEASGYCFRFDYDSQNDEYVWTEIRDSRINEVLQELINVDGDLSNLKSFQTTTNSWMTHTDSELSNLQSRTSTVETTLGDKVDSTVFNEVAQTVDSNRLTITTLTETVNSKADQADLTSLTNTVNMLDQSSTETLSRIYSISNALGGRRFTLDSFDITADSDKPYVCDIWLCDQIACA